MTQTFVLVVNSVCKHARRFSRWKTTLAVTKVDEVPADAEETCRQAAEECPVEAIIIEG